MKSTVATYPMNPSSIAKVTLKWILPFTFLLLLIFGLHYSIHNTLDLKHREQSEKMHVELASKILHNNLHGIMTDTNFLTHFVGKFITSSKGMNESLVKLFQHQFLTFSQNKKVYDKIRLFDPQGKELIHVNYQDGESLLVDNSQLQNKKNRGYFQKIVAQPSNTPYISPLEPNVENNTIEFPVKPIIRVGKTIRDESGKLIAVVILNYLGKNLFNDLDITAGDNNRNITLIDNESFYITGSDHLQYGYLFNDKEGFDLKYNEAWKIIKASRLGQFMNNDGLFSFTSINPLLTDMVSTEFYGNSYHWKVISHVNQDILNETCLAFLGFYIVLYLAIFIVAVIVSVVIAINLMRRKNIEIQNEYERQFRTILEDVQLLALMVDSNGNITFCNDYFLNLTSWTRDKALDKNWHSCFVFEGDIEIAEKLALEINNKHEAVTDIEFSVVTTKNQRKTITWNATPTQNASGKFLGITYIGMDVTSQRQMEDKVRLLNRAVEQSPVVVMLTDTSGRIEYVNNRFFKLTGYSREEIIGHSPKMLKSGETSAIEYKKLWQSITRGEEWRGIFHNRKKNGELYWEAAFISAVKNEEGEITNFLAIKEDITEIRHLRDEVTWHQYELSETKELATVGRMANMIAHDLRNPLSSIKMGVQILHKQALKKEDEKQRELMDISLQQIRYMEEILKDLLSYSRQDELKLEWLTIEKILDDAIFLLHKQIEDTKAVIKRQYQKGIPTLNGDEVRLKQIFTNLISNAIQASEGNDKSIPEIIISTSLSLGDAVTSIQIEVADNGTGIDPEIEDSLFDPFITTRAKGTGLGLAIVERVIKQHNGQISIESSTTCGTRAKVILPVGPVNNAITNKWKTVLNSYE